MFPRLDRQRFIGGASLAADVGAALAKAERFRGLPGVCPRGGDTAAEGGMRGRLAAEREGWAINRRARQLRICIPRETALDHILSLSTVPVAVSE